MKNKIKNEVIKYVNENTNRNSFKFSSFIHKEVIFETDNSFDDDYYLKESDDFQLLWDVVISGQQIRLENFSFDGQYYILSYDDNTIVETKNINEINWEFVFDIGAFKFDEELYVSTVLFSFGDKKCYIYFNE